MSLDRDLRLDDLDRDLLRGLGERLRRDGESMRGVTILDRHDSDLIGDMDLRGIGGDHLRGGDRRTGDRLRELRYGDLRGDRPFLLGDLDPLRRDLDRDLSDALGLSRLPAGLLLLLAAGDLDLDLLGFFFLGSGDLALGGGSFFFFFATSFSAEDLLESLLEPLPLLLESLSLLLLLLLLRALALSAAFLGAGSAEGAFFISASLLSTGVSSFGLVEEACLESQRDGALGGVARSLLDTSGAVGSSCGFSFPSTSTELFSLAGDGERDEAEDDDDEDRDLLSEASVLAG